VRDIGVRNSAGVSGVGKAMAVLSSTSRRGILPLTLVVCALLAAARPASSFRDCCFGGTVPPMLTAFLLPAESEDEGLERAAALGFDARTDHMGNARAALDRGYLSWGSVGGPGAYGSVAAPTGMPVVAPVFYLLCGHPRPDRPTGSEPGAWHPNGALQLTGAIAVVSDLEAACASMPASLSHSNLAHSRIGFEGPRPVPALSAVSRTGATSDGTTLTVLAADDQAEANGGRVERWLASAGPRWLGFTVSVRDLNRTASLLTSHGVAYDEIRIGESYGLLVETDGPGGTVVVFHPSGFPPFGGSSRVP
jgi:hypothetical protein